MNLNARNSLKFFDFDVGLVTLTVYVALTIAPSSAAAPNTTSPDDVLTEETSSPPNTTPLALVGLPVASLTIAN